MSSTSNQIEQECRRRMRSVSGSGSVSSPNSAGSSLAPSPPNPRRSLLTFHKGSDDLPQVWDDELHSCQLAQNRDSARLESEYHIYGLEFHLCRIEPRPKHPLSRIRPVPQVEEYILSARHNRYFIWGPRNTEHPLQYIRTPWSLKGLLSALNNANEELVTQPVHRWYPTAPSPEDITPWPFTSLPHDWTNRIPIVLCDHRATDFRDYDRTRRHPILYYHSGSGEEDANLFESEGNFYLYKPYYEHLFEMPDLQYPQNLHKLGSAPDYHGLQLIPVGPAEIFGGRRSLNGTTIPQGWNQMPWDPARRVLGLPARCYDYDLTSVLSTADGTRHIIEVESEYYLWFGPEQVVSKIEAPKGLEGILRTTRSGLLLDLRDP